MQRNCIALVCVALALTRARDECVLMNAPIHTGSQKQIKREEKGEKKSQREIVESKYT